MDDPEGPFILEFLRNEKLPRMEKQKYFCYEGTRKTGFEVFKSSFSQ